MAFSVNALGSNVLLIAERPESGKIKVMGPVQDRRKRDVWVSPYNFLSCHSCS